MYAPTEIEKKNCYCIIKDILKSDNDFECEKYAKDIFNTIYSLGGDYSEKTLRSVAEIILKNVLK